MTKKIYRLVGIVLLAAGVGGAFIMVKAFWGGKSAVGKRDVWAMGLRGTAKVSQRLSDLQRGRLERHFLHTPPRAHSLAGHSVDATAGAVGEVQQINEFNRRQGEHR
ncbi:MAG: hypothetical protein LHV69_02950 [Elusimicrobia bacterium]|nr:hypothetical protein [Candidatus Obscuribacterium magneticum]